MRRKVTTIGRDYNEVSKQKLNRLALPTIKDIKNKHDSYKKKKEKINPELYVLLLKGFEEELLQNIAKLREDKKKIKSKDNSDFLLVKNDNKKSKIEINKKFIYSKEYFNINFILNNKVFKMKFKDYEGLKNLIENKKEIIEEMKRIHKNSVKFLVHLKEKDKTIDHNSNQYTALLKFKKKEHAKIEKRYERLLKKKKKKRTKSVLLSRLFSRNKKK